ncbi:MAG TPA: hypothetical protein PL110_08900 [Candidatus Eremiobacteraeota bacterium]|nr:MAG: hypothetical protein BWY64_01589 [bacterium ADurb.Bin363]HPZ08219.1 hypothetical protein [Candidatus Eremiobacteraeota bacterium]
MRSRLQNEGSPFVIETVGIINNRYEVKYNLPVNYYFEKIKTIDEKFLTEEELKKSSFFIPPLCEDLFSEIDSADLSAYALSFLDGRKQDFNYYVDLANYYKEKAENEQKSRHLHQDGEEIAQAINMDILLPSDKTSMSAEALARMDGYQYDFQYYVDLANYYKDMEDYEQKLAAIKRGDDETQPLIPLERESFSLTPEALAYTDGYQYDFNYYIELSSYYEKSREYQRNKDLFDAGFKDTFKDSNLKISSGKERTSLSAEALATADGYQYDFQYYKNLSEYYKEAEEYERKMELYNAGEKDVFQKQETGLTLERESFELSPEALAHADGYQYDLDYYKNLSKYYSDMEEYNRKLELFNTGDKEIFKRKIEIGQLEKEKVFLSAEALAKIDGYQYDFQYYIKLENYYKELDAYNRKKELMELGIKDIFESSKEEIELIDKIELGVKDERIWTPSIEDLLAFSRGKSPPYFLDTLLYMLKRVDTGFNDKIRGSNLRLRMDWNTKVMESKEFEDLMEEIQSKILPE